ncbi:MAG TPA: glycosyltransferase family 87 protein [Pseudonocardia sp.]|nr:glycosyltransferase family 87 protein [Pseudonocardia sp.]
MRAGVAGLVAVVAVLVTVVLHATHSDPLVTRLLSADMRGLHVDFDTFHHSAVVLVEQPYGADIYTTPALLTNLNPPLMTALFAPFAAVDALTGYRILAALTLVAVVLALLAVARELRLGRAVTVAAVLAVVASSPLHGTLVLGQVYGLLLVGLVAGWVAQRRGHPMPAAVLWGVTVALKPSLAPLLLLAAAVHRWRPLAAGVAAAAAATLVGALVAGPANTVRWLGIALTEPVPGVTDNASLPGLAVRFGAPAPVGTLIGAAVLVGTLAYLARHRDRVDPAGTAPWAVLAAGLLVAPIAWHNYLLLVVPGVFVLLARRRLAVAAALLALPLVPIAWNGVLDGRPGGALAGSLYCAILVAHWAVLLREARGEPAVAERPRIASGAAAPS